MLTQLHQQFIQERLYLKSVTEKTIQWHRESWTAFSKHLPNEALTQTIINQTVVAIRQSGLGPISTNTYCRAVNAFLRWLHEQGHAKELFKCPRQKEPQQVMPTYTGAHVQRLIDYKPRRSNDRRAWVLAMTLLDTGLRLAEALALQRGDLNFDDMLICVDGKGQKQRLVPMSSELRRILFRWLQQHEHRRVFATRTGTRLSERNAQRDFGDLCHRLGIEGVRRKIHALRHTFAVNYLRNGGDVFRLQRILGHTTLEMTRRYVNLQTADLQAVHNKLSMLARR